MRVQKEMAPSQCEKQALPQFFFALGNKNVQVCNFLKGYNSIEGNTSTDDAIRFIQTRPEGLQIGPSKPNQ